MLHPVIVALSLGNFLNTTTISHKATVITRKLESWLQEWKRCLSASPLSTISASQHCSWEWPPSSINIINPRAWFAPKETCGCQRVIVWDDSSDALLRSVLTAAHLILLGWSCRWGAGVQWSTVNYGCHLMWLAAPPPSALLVGQAGRWRSRITAGGAAVPGITTWAHRALLTGAGSYIE